MGGGGRVRPGLEIHLLRIARQPQRVVALAHQVHNAGLVEVVPKDLIELAREVGERRIGRYGLEGRDSQPDPRRAQIDARRKPVLAAAGT